ncbi:MFS transporter [Actinospica robiniae]|uniref:MFS transporter n=1 Tax=Actinospica robiniae TaxID=304901 RepID=UPI00040F35E0|nr:MFS transporter [Actinospica robiniae]
MAKTDTSRPAGAVTPVLRRARVAGYVSFGAQGFAFSLLTSEVANIQDKLGIDDGTLSILLAVVPVIAGVGSVAAGFLVGRYSSSGVLRVAQILVPVSILLAGYAPSFAVMLPVLALFGLAVGAVDATTNMQAVALQRRYGRSIILSFHGCWALGAFAGSAAASLTSRFDGKVYSNLYLTSTILVVPLLLAFGPRLLRGIGDETLTAEAKTIKIPWKPMAAICVVITLAYLGDSTVSSAGGVYMEKELMAHGWQYTAVYAVYSVPLMIGRFSGDRLTDRFGGVLIARVAAVCAVLGFLLVCVAPDAWAALAGFAVVGLGISVMAPLTFAAAGRLDPHETGIAVARLNVFNYLGFLLGAPLLTSLWQARMPYRPGWLIPATLAALMFVFAYGFDERRTGAV